MRHRGEWMQLPTDDYILETLDTGLGLTPAVIAWNIDKGRTTVQKRLNPLASAGLIERVDEKGYYRITDDGHAYLEGDLDASELEPAED
ncbi:winged helix-turn-helix domain-containing protein [Natrinema salaciae]|uniref:Uncharacterized protein n=1 Tax=Natrinema salaciae TaxID=1186196 RepID=A0A1H9RR12_9EURY|nr:winged helix-turn-helix domain-containing protein [Natrinema salaciae]SER74895.1 hypothetical protein SAMN04489841_4496 [Natrinema salaciae]